jgi:hypothetical protein
MDQLDAGNIESTGHDQRSILQRIRERSMPERRFCNGYLSRLLPGKYAGVTIVPYNGWAELYIHLVRNNSCQRMRWTCGIAQCTWHLGMGRCSSDTLSDPDPQPEACCSNPDANAETFTNARTKPDSNTKSFTDADPKSEAFANADSNAQAFANTEL